MKKIECQVDFFAIEGMEANPEGCSCICGGLGASTIGSTNSMYGYCGCGCGDVESYNANTQTAHNYMFK